MHFRLCGLKLKDLFLEILLLLDNVYFDFFSIPLNRFSLSRLFDIHWAYVKVYKNKFFDFIISQINNDC